jgi:cytochrome P450
MRRLTLRPFTFSNGVTVPAGTYLSIPTNATQTDERTFSNPHEFDGFRFANLRDREGVKATGRYQMVSASNDHLVFGLGRHTWQAFLLAVHDP